MGEFPLFLEDHPEFEKDVPKMWVIVSTGVLYFNNGKDDKIQRIVASDKNELESSSTPNGAGETREQTQED